MIAADFWGVKARKSQSGRNFPRAFDLIFLFVLYANKLYGFVLLC